MAQGRARTLPAVWAALVNADEVRAAEFVGVCIDCGSPTRAALELDSDCAGAPRDVDGLSPPLPALLRPAPVGQAPGRQGRPAAPSGHVRELRGRNGHAAHVFSRPRGWRLLARVRVCLADAPEAAGRPSRRALPGRGVSGS